MADSLEDLILSQLSSLSLSTEPDTVEFVQGIVEEDTIELEVTILRAEWTTERLLTCSL